MAPPFLAVHSVTILPDIRMTCAILSEIMLQRLCLVCFSGAGLWLGDSLAAADALSAPLHFEFREPQLKSYRVEAPPARRSTSSISTQPSATRLRAWPEDGSTNYVEFGNRVVLELSHTGDPEPLLSG